MSYHGDIRLEDTIDMKFCTVDVDGVPFTLAGSPAISAYPGNSTTQVTAGITLSVDFDGVTGLNNVRVVATNANGYAAGNYSLVITTGTVDGASVVGYVVASFSIDSRSALRPTTAARTLDVTATGEAGIDWANIGGPTTTQTLSGTTVGVATDITTKTGYRLSATGVDDILDEVVDGSFTLRQLTRLFASALGAKASGLATATAVYRDVSDTKPRITATVDADGNRSAVTLDLT